MSHAKVVEGDVDDVHTHARCSPPQERFPVRTLHLTRRRTRVGHLGPPIQAHWLDRSPQGRSLSTPTRLSSRSLNRHPQGAAAQVTRGKSLVPHTQLLLPNPSHKDRGTMRKSAWHGRPAAHVRGVHEAPPTASDGLAGCCAFVDRASSRTWASPAPFHTPSAPLPPAALPFPQPPQGEPLDWPNGQVDPPSKLEVSSRPLRTLPLQQPAARTSAGRETRTHRL